MSSMNDNFKLLNGRIYKACEVVTKEELILKLKDIKGNIITTGTGGSYPVSHYASLVMSDVNKCFSKNVYPREATNTDCDALMAFSYSGFTPSIVNALQQNNCASKVLFTNSINKELHDYSFISYEGDREHSFISIASAFIPMSLLYNYATLETPLNELLEKEKSYELIGMIPSYIKTVEIFSGSDTNTAAYLLQSGLVESGIAYTVVHEKNNYAHGCATLNYKQNTDLAIYLLNNVTDYDLLMKLEVMSHYKNVIYLSSKYDKLTAEFDLALNAMYLLRDIAVEQDIDLSIVDYPKSIKKIYSFNGKMV